MKPNDIHGIWRVVEHKLSDPEHVDYKNIMRSFDQYCLKGTELEISRNGNMSWSGHSNEEMHPYLKAKSFTIVEGYKVSLIWMYIGKGSLKIEFEIALDRDLLSLHHKHGINLEMQRVSEKTSDEKPFSLCDALCDDEFKDFEIVSESGKHFSCHKCILSSVFKEENWQDGNHFLSNSSDNIIAAVLHFSYCGCLPSWLDLNGAQTLMKVLQGTTASPPSILATVQSYLHCLGVIDLLQGIARDIENCFTSILHLLTGVESALAICASTSSAEEVDKLVHHGKQILQEAILGLFSLLSWCKTYTEGRNILTMKMKKEACQKILDLFLDFGREIKSRNHRLVSKAALLPMASFSSMSETLLPEFEKVLQDSPAFYSCWTSAVTGIFDDLIEANKQAEMKQKGVKFFWGIYNTMVFEDMEQLCDLKEVLDCKVDDTFEILENARQSDQARKQEILSGFLKVVIKILVFDISPHTDFGEDQRVIFKLEQVASRATCMLEKLTKQKQRLGMLITGVKEFMCRESFNNILESLGLEEPEGKENNSLVWNKKEIQHSDISGNYLTSAAPAEINSLSKCLKNLLEKSLLSDLTFIVAKETDDSQERNEEVAFKAHRVVMAARCKWFRRALASGMKESIDRIFHIKDFLPETFMNFLRYLYIGHIADIEEFSVESIADLMTIADCYGVDDLEEVCERLLIRKIKNDNIEYLDSIAESILAKKLKAAITLYKNECTEHEV